MKLGTMVFLAGVAAESKTLAMTYFSSGVSCSAPTDWRASKVNGLRGSWKRFFCCSSRRSTRSRTTCRSSFCSFLRYSWPRFGGQEERAIGLRAEGGLPDFRLSVHQHGEIGQVGLRLSF